MKGPRVRDVLWRAGDKEHSWGHLRGYAVATEPSEPALKLLIAGFRNEKELEVFVLRLRGMGLLTLYDIEGKVNGTSEDLA